MELILVLKVYLLFCLTTAVMANFTILTPVIAELSPRDNIKQNPWVARFAFFCIAAVVAPVLFIILILPELKDSFIDKMSESLNQD